MNSMIDMTDMVGEKYQNIHICLIDGLFDNNNK